MTCVISDEAPADDSTLLANDDRWILIAHLEKTERDLRAGGFIIGFLLIGRDYWRELELCERGSEPQAAGLPSLSWCEERSFQRLNSDVIFSNRAVYMWQSRSD